MRLRLLLLAFLLTGMPACSGVYLQSEFSSGVDPTVVATELIPAHAPLLLQIGSSVDGGPQADAGALAMRFHDALARALDEAGVALTRDPAAAGSVLAIAPSTEMRRRTKWQSGYPGGYSYRASDGTMRFSHGYYYSRPYTVYDRWQRFGVSLFLGDQPVPQWSGAVEMSDAYPDRKLESSAVELVRMLLAGEAQEMDFVILDT